MEKVSKRLAFKILKEVFLRNGYVRIKDESKLKELGSQKYKQGYEVRLIAKDEAELERIRTAISVLDLHVAKSYLNGKQFVQPIYGKEVTRKFEKLKPKKESVL
ncbi:hypothetical protein [Algoriphagus mannitolivorans]|uniref:hypothetical protein n=1 Tax=Algoriphagus mannitolivorans TaxID=226504 RepID=UPI000420A531|nr:hypothetical protein [Algoriphagus mannitolivorans]